MSLRTRAANRFVRRPHIHARVPVERRRDAAPCANRRENPFDDALVDRLSAVAHPVLALQVRRVRMQAVEPTAGHGLRREVQQLVRQLDRDPRFRRELDAEPDPRPDDGERPVRHGGRYSGGGGGGM